MAAMFKISSMKSPMIFATTPSSTNTNSNQSHRVSVMVNGSVISEEESNRLKAINSNTEHRVVLNNNGVISGNKGRVLIAKSNDTSKIYLEGKPVTAEDSSNAVLVGSNHSSVTAPVSSVGTTSIRVSEVLNRDAAASSINEDCARTIRDSSVVRASVEPVVGSTTVRLEPLADDSRVLNETTSVLVVKPGLTLEQEEFKKDSSNSPVLSEQRRSGGNRFPLVHQSRFDEETDGPPRIVGSISSFNHIVSVKTVTTSPVSSTMVPGAPDQKTPNENCGQKSYDLDDRNAASDVSVKVTQYVTLGGGNVDGSIVATQEEWIKNEVNLVPNLDDSLMEGKITSTSSDIGGGNGAEDMNVIRINNNNNINNNPEDIDVVAEGIKLRVSFGSNRRDHQEEMVSRSPDDGYHDDDTLSEEESGLQHPVVINETVPSANDGIHVAIPVRLTSDSTTNYDREMRFITMNHVRHDSDVFDDDANSSLGSETGTILSRRGTIRGMKNHVRSSIAAFLENMASKRQYGKEETGRVVLYTTSMGVVRRTHDLCRRARNIMYTLMIRFEERDVFMNRLFQQEVCERLHLEEVIVPQLFVDGVHIGNADVIERLNETGELRKLLEPYKRQSVGTVCQMCGDFRFLPCTTCGGSKKSSQHRHQFSEEIVALRCMVCDENGLIRCNLCLNDDQS